jgi:hypothetical protein
MQSTDQLSKFNHPNTRLTESVMEFAEFEEEED